MAFVSYPGFAVPEGVRHAPLARRTVRLHPDVLAFVGYSSSIFSAIRTPHGYYLVDAGDDVPGVRDALAEIRRFAPGTLQGIFLTHSHPDHRGGGSIFLEEARGREIPVWAHHAFGSEMQDGRGLERILQTRAGRQFGAGIPDAEYTSNSLLPHFPGGFAGPLLQPNRQIFEGRTRLYADDLAVDLLTVPTETGDHMEVFLPESRVLFSGDAVYGALPNLYPLRGGCWRQAERWAQGIRRLLELDPEAAVCGHNLVLQGRQAVRQAFERCANAIECIVAETLKGMDEGLGPDELACRVRLPEELARDPNLGEFYGAVPWIVREIYAAKMGWFDGNATNVVHLAPWEEAERLARLAGGAAALAAQAQSALAEGDWRWTCRLCDWLLRLGPEHAATARGMKAEALEALSQEILPMAGRNWLKSSAMALREEGQEDAGQ